MEGADVIGLRAALDPGDDYGAARRLAADHPGAVRRQDPDRASRLIVGPHDPTDRFAYWPRRIARGGRVLAPGDPSDLTQFIDVRDLADWTLGAALDRLAGVFNVTGAPMPLKRLLEHCKAVVGGAAELIWAPSDRLIAAGVDPWMGVPLWIAAPGWEGASLVDTSLAVAAGLAPRDLDDTIRATFAWDTERGGPQPGREGLTMEREAALLTALAEPYPVGWIGVLPKFLAERASTAQTLSGTVKYNTPSTNSGEDLISAGWLV